MIKKNDLKSCWWTVGVFSRISRKQFTHVLAKLMVEPHNADGV